ncbi:unnamed protein product [Rhizoctonia solani]|uniref:Uncharacterized protein n=1 Tax=Rhizoctonia solani TaxID=456999 RepID=A0A8H3E655_9AGAM|nr:unnamed protein product [Rhizoctonia solani]
MFVLPSVSIFSLADDAAKPDYLIEPNGGDRPQLVHRQDHIDQPSRFVRFATRLGLTNGDKPVLEAVEKAHRFITSNYKPGDQITLVVIAYAKWEMDPHAKAIDMLAWNLYNGTSPSDRSKARPGTGGNSGQIPIYAVGAWVYPEEKQSLSSWIDGWKLRLPPGIEHIICWDADPFRSCSSTFDQDGILTSRELRFSYNGDYLKFCRDLTKHVLYHKQDQLPKWDEHPPVWTHVLGSSSRKAQEILPLNSVRPAGMYHHELRSYQGLPAQYGNVYMVVWKATQNGERLGS